MHIVRPYALLRQINDLEGALSIIEYIGRVSHRSEDAQTSNTTEKFINSVVMRHGDWSIVEHVPATVEFLADRGITHEIVRHRLFSYTQESTRFVNYAKKMPPSFIYPKPEIECPECLGGDQPRKSTILDDNFVHSNLKICSYDRCWLDAIMCAESAYVGLLAEGWRPQEARSVFPNALASKLIMTGNLRAWRHFFAMRTSKESHPQMRQVTIPLLEQFKRVVPILYDDIQPEATQFENMSKPQ